MNVSIAPILPTASRDGFLEAWLSSSNRCYGMHDDTQKTFKGCWWISFAWQPVFTRRVNNKPHIHLATHEPEVQREWRKYSRQTTAIHSSVCLTSSRVILSVLLSVILSNHSI